jgi:predicted MFS family arabinose efflux permease
MQIRTLLVKQAWQNPATFLLLMAFVSPLAFSTWAALINNFSQEVVDFSGQEIGLLHSLREIPGFLAFTTVFLLLFIREQRFALLASFVLAAGVLLTGYFPSVWGLYLTTIFMSLGFHYFDTVNRSLTLQWIDKTDTPHFMGRVLAVRAAASILVFGLLWLLLEYFDVSYRLIYTVFGGAAMLLIIVLWLGFPQFEAKTEQNKTLFLRKTYWLYYLLTFLSGARRQIFMVFAGFLLVEKFGYSAAAISLLFLVNYIFNLFFAAKIGKLIGVLGERRALSIEYIGLIVVFSAYAIVDNAKLAGLLYIIDHFFFAFAIAISTYFQKIARPDDIASTAAVSFTINHIAAVGLPAILGIIWLQSNALVFMIGAVIALMSLLLSQLIPNSPCQGNESRYFRSHFKPSIN